MIISWLAQLPTLTASAAASTVPTITGVPTASSGFGGRFGGHGAGDIRGPAELGQATEFNNWCRHLRIPLTLRQVVQRVKTRRRIVINHPPTGQVAYEKVVLVTNLAACVDPGSWRRSHKIFGPTDWVERAVPLVR